MIRMLKKILRSRGGLFITAALIALVMVLLCVSVRWQVQNKGIMRKLRKDGHTPILIFWHEHIFCMPWIGPSHTAALQSPHADGRLLAYATMFFGVKPVFGSSNRQALSGMRSLIRQMQAGRVAAISPDGPRGPARHMASGTIALAQITGQPIIPCVWAAKRCWRTNSWDRMRIPKPFSRGLVLWGEPITLPKKSTKIEQEQARLQLETTLSDLTKRCDAIIAGTSK